LPPSTDPSLFRAAGVGAAMNSLEGDIRDAEQLARAIADHRPEVVLHLAAQSLVGYSYDAPTETFGVNVMGTVHLLDAVRACDGVRAVIVVTSDKCYENREWVWPYREGDPLGGRDPYSSSKACAELVVASYRRSFFESMDDLSGPALATARAGNVLGGGDWAENRLVPDVIRSLIDERPLVLRYPESTRPWQHVLDPLAGYLVLAQHIVADPALAGPWNFAPGGEERWTVRRIGERLADLLERPCAWVAHPGPVPHEAGSLRLDASKTRALLLWAPRFSVDDTLLSVAEWYAGHAAGRPAAELVDAEFDRYQRLATC